MTELDPNSRIVDLARLNSNILTAIRDNKSIFEEFSKLDRTYIMFRADPESFADDCPYRPAPQVVTPQALDIIRSASTEETEEADLTTSVSHNKLLDLTTLSDDQLEAIANDVDAFAYLNFQEQIWLYNFFNWKLNPGPPRPFFPSMHLIKVINEAPSEHSAGGKRKKSRKPSSHYKPTKSRKTRRRK